MKPKSFSFYVGSAVFSIGGAGMLIALWLNMVFAGHKEYGLGPMFWAFTNITFIGVLWMCVEDTIEE